MLSFVVPIVHSVRIFTGDAPFKLTRESHLSVQTAVLTDPLRSGDRCEACQHHFSDRSADKFFRNLRVWGLRRSMPNVWRRYMIGPRRQFCHRDGRISRNLPFPIMDASQATTKWSFEGHKLPIDTVTVYRPRGAQITRKLDLDLEVCQVPHIPAHLIPLRLFSRI